MARPNKPGYFSSRNCWRFMFEGKVRYICKGVRPDQRPQREGIPRIVWDEMDRIISEAADKASAGVDPTVRWLVNGYIEWAKGENEGGRMSRKQYLNVEIHLTHFATISGKASNPARTLSAADLDDFFDQFRASPMLGRSGPPSAHYVHNVGKSIRAMYRWASRPVPNRQPARLIHPNPIDGYPFPKQPGSVRGYVEGAVVRRFLRWAWGKARWADNDRRSVAPGGPAPLKPPESTARSLKRRFDRLFLLMLRFQRLTGCRPGEACRLEWAELAAGPAGRPRWDGGVITIRPDRVKTRKQTDRARRIWITPPVARLLRAIERLDGHHPVYVFTHMRAKGSERRGQADPLAGEPWPDGSSASAKLTKLRAVAVEAGLAGVESVGPKKLVAYSNRHGYASEGSSLGFSDEQIAEQLGNSPDVMRRVYAHTVDEAAQRRADEIAERRRSIVRRKRGD